MTPAERALLVAVLDTLIPAAEGFPGAGAAALDHVVAKAASNPLVAEGLREVERQAAGAGDFAALGADEREAVLRRVEAGRPDVFEALVRHTYEGYYSHPTVVARLGLEPGPVHPRGHRIEPVEFPDLGRVTVRGPMYRSA